ncbi:MAG: T9SS type A sorting domain-containing protein [Bacteroidetes bacterium]|nr:T9SS type A sorting domain-containing protein [Bacteroidota bacterium]
MKKRIFTHFTKMLFVISAFLLLNNFCVGQSAGDFRSKSTGGWNVAATWETYDGISTWNAAIITPTASSNVYLQTGFTVTLSQNEACNDLYINNAAGTRLAIGAFIFEINGKILSYNTGAGVFPVVASSTVGSSCITSTDGVGKMKFIGTTRTIMLSGEWGNNPQAWDAEFAPTAGNTFSIQTGFKARNITVSSGTVTSSNTLFCPDGGAAGTGTLTLKSGAVLQFSGASANMRRVGTAGATSHFNLLTVESGAVLDYSGNSSPTIGANTFALNGTVKYSGAGAQTLAAKGGNSSGVEPNTYTNLTLSNAGVKTTIPAQTTFINGILSLQGTASLALGATSILTYGAASSLEYAGSGVQTTTLVEFPVTSVNNLIINNTHEVIIDATRTIIGNATVYPLANLTLNAGSTLTIGGGFFIQSDATGTGSFIENGTLTVGTSTVQKYLTDSRWWYVGSPMLSGATTLNFGTLSAGSGTGMRLLYYNEILQDYTAVINGDDINIAQRGFAFRNFDAGATTVAFTGTLNNAAIGAPGSLTRQAAGTFNGYNLVCNSYPSAINWGTVNTPTTGLTKTHLETTIWYRKDGGFATFNSSGDGTGENGGQQYIPAMQAFWVRVAAGNTTGGFELANTARTHNSQAFYKMAAETNIFRMDVSNGTNSDEVVVGFYADALNTYENYDSEKMFYTDENVPQTYSLTSDSKQTAINGQSVLVLNDERIIPLGFSTPVSGTFTFSATNMNDFDATVSVYLEDVQISTIQDLRETSAYTFTSEIANNATRFKLHFILGSATGISDITSDAITVYTSNNKVYANNPVSGKGTIEVYDIVGKLIVSKEATQGMNVISLNVNNGIYLIKVTNGNQAISKKVFIEN